ncbi:MAG: phosphate ABC transporter permease subunit PstC [Actinomycetes bacterium]
MSTQVIQVGSDLPGSAPERFFPTAKPSASDRIFRLALRIAASSALALMGLIGLFLFIKAWPALKTAGLSFLTTSQWLPDTGEFGVASVLEGTIVVALIAMTIALPIGFGAAVFISEYAPARIKRPLISLIDLMAAVPSIVYALVGFFLLQPLLIGPARWMATYLDFLPFLRVEPMETDTSFTASAFIAGCVVGIVVIPTVTSIMREVFSQAPTGEREGALALGSTKWGMIRTVVLPFGRSGVIAGTMLGLGRALGETITVYLIITPIFTFTLRPLQAGTNTISSLIAARYSESSDVALAGLLGAGLVLFVFTLVINAIAAVATGRSRSGSTTEI